VVLGFRLFLAAVYVQQDRAVVDWTQPVRILILELIEPGTTPSAGLLAINRPDGLSLAAAGRLLADEYERYHAGCRPVVQIDVAGPFAVDVHAPDLLDHEAGRVELLRRNVGFIRYF
jgi:hypothetical protein